MAKKQSTKQSKKEVHIQDNTEFKVGDTIFYCRFLPNAGISEIIEMRISVFYDNCIIGVIQNNKELAKQRFTVDLKYLGELAFHDRKMAVSKLKEIEKKNKYIKRQFTIAEEDGEPTISDSNKEEKEDE